MRLINAQTLKLEEYLNDKVEPYAILSHRWGNSEMSLLDMHDLRPGETANSQGFVKIKYACKQAIRDGYKYVWVDTCCINKDSSAEVSEAINSMYRWYQRAAVCYVFLSDVDTKAGNSETFDNSSKQLHSSEWFDRGWTLQELLAPREVNFYDKHWQFIGTKLSRSHTISSRSNIAADMLCGTKGLTDYSIAQRMSWASRRVTTREEDIAYCLLGIFDVNMPLIYGEGEKAFIRLQEEIMKHSDDHSIFAWDISRTEQPGLLADSPSAFVNCWNVIPTSSRRGRAPYAMTNRGLSLKLSAVPWGPDTYAARLDCSHEYESTKCLGIFFRRLYEDDQYARVGVDGHSVVIWPHFVWRGASLELPRSEHIRGLIDINVRQQITASNTNAFKERVYGFRIHKELFARSLDLYDKLPKVVEAWREMEETNDTRMWRHFRLINTFSINCQDSKVRVMSLGFDFDHNPVCFVATSYELNLMRGFTELSDEEHNQHRVLKNRSAIDTFTWSKISGVEAEELLHHPGMWAIKGDRIKGIRVVVGDFGLLEIAREETECGRLVWGVCRVPYHPRSPSVTGSASESAHIPDLDFDRDPLSELLQNYVEY